jgi:hypothetical protein
MSDFDEFWAAYPRKVGKLAALRAYRKARSLASADEILDGIAVYREHKPAYADWCHPTTFLNQGRWMDEYSETVKPSADDTWFTECQRLHQGQCGGSMKHRTRMLIDRAKGA